MLLCKCERCGNIIDNHFSRMIMYQYKIRKTNLEECEKSELCGWSADLCDSCLSDLQVWLEEKRERKGGQKHDD